MPNSISLATDKDNYSPGDTLTADVTVEASAAYQKTYRIVAGVVIGGQTYNAEKEVTVTFPAPEVGDVVISVIPSVGAPAFSLTAVDADTFQGQVPNA